MIEYAQWIAIFVALINLFLSFSDKRLFKFFKTSDATAPEKGINIDALGTLLRWRLKRMHRKGFILKSENNTYYFDENIYRSKRKTRQIRVIILVILTILIVLYIIYLSR